ncbi:MAG: histidinol-phosphate transaminase [Gemmatimonadaceae bacterium]
MKPRREILETPPVHHGGRLAGTGDLVATSTKHQDFSVCLNAYGPAPIVRSAIRESPIDEYPDRLSRAPRQAVAYRCDRPMNEIVFGAGASELIQAVCFAYLSRGDCVVIMQPAFGEYERASLLCGAQIHHPTNALNHAAPTLDDSVTELVSTIFRVRPRLVFMATPTSPSGAQYAVPMLRHIANMCAQCDSLLILDQSYDAFSANPLGTPALPGNDHVVHIRSLTKDHALAGIRVAFAVAPPDVANDIERGRVPWAASSAAQDAAVAAMSDEAMRHVAETTRCLRADAVRIAVFCASIGLWVEPSSTHYLLIRCVNAAAAHDSLLRQHGVLVRDCCSFGLPQHIRVAARRPDDNTTLLDALRSLSSHQTS